MAGPEGVRLRAAQNRGRRARTTPKRGTLTEAEIREAAGKLGVEPAALAAVAEVETGPQGAFDKEGRPTILFERHVFHRLTQGRFDHAVLAIDGRTYRLSDPSPGGYGLYSHQYLKLDEAERLDPYAAEMACSWGLFQIMGENFAACGYLGVTSMRDAMWAGVEHHLEAFVNFIASNPVTHAGLSALEWPLFAYHYNGPGYAKNNYDRKMAAAYRRLSDTTYKEA